MPETQPLLMFLLAGVLLNLTPGPDVLYIVNQSVRGGVGAGLVAAWGITAGCCVHVALAAFGLGAVLASSADAFNLVKWAGALYLLWVGVGLLWRAPRPSLLPTSLSTGDHGQPDVSASRMPSRRAVFFGAFATNALNPKVALFFLAFVPQFIPAHAQNPTWSFVLLGGLFNLNSLLVCTAWALAASWLTQNSLWLQGGMRHLDRVAGLLFVGFGLKLAFSDAPAH